MYNRSKISIVKQTVVKIAHDQGGSYFTWKNKKIKWLFHLNINSYYTSLTDQWSIWSVYSSNKAVYWFSFVVVSCSECSSRKEAFSESVCLY